MNIHTLKAILLIAIFIFILKVNAQQPIGITENTLRNANGSWTVVSDGIQDGATGGSIYFDNYPYVEINKDTSYWVAGEIVVNFDPDDDEASINYTDPCAYREWPIHNSPDADTNRAAYFSSFFQLFHSDIGGYMRKQEPVGVQTDRYHRIFFTRHSSDVDQHHAMSSLLNGTLVNGDTIQFIMAFVRGINESGTEIEIGDTRIPAGSRQGSFIYYRIINGTLKYEEMPDPTNNLCYNATTAFKDEHTTRIYIASDSHGNLQNWEPSVQLWNNRRSSGEFTCGDVFVPHNMNPLLGTVNRMIFVQDVLDITDINGFFANPHNYNPSDLVLDFPEIVDAAGGYSLVIPFSHWMEYDHANAGSLRTTVRYDLPNCDIRIAFRTYYTGGGSAINYGIRYRLDERQADIDMEFDTIAFYMTNWAQDWNPPEFHFYAWVNAADLLGGTDEFYVQISPLISSWSWDGSYLKVPFTNLNQINERWYHYIFGLEEIFLEARTRIPSFTYHRIDSVEQICFRGQFEIAGLVLSNIRSLEKPNVKCFEVSSMPNSFTIDNFPNPFNPSTTIVFSIPESGNVTIKIYNLLGELITTLYDGYCEVGNHKIIWNSTNIKGTQVSNGVYFYNIIYDGNNSITKRMLLLK